ncbi:MAG: UDP-N-acetylglucosamine pyrophosphorylase [Lachnospiraceae bacterium]|nr:UDP-N-acetylglucosamine pyrophosphorylase [Lachnospiraceae bacterium]
MKEQITIRELYDLKETLAAPLLEQFMYPWEVLPKIGDFIKEIGATLPDVLYEQRDENVWVARSAKIYPNNYIAGPCIIGERTEVRPGAFIRGNALVGNDCVVGNSTELKNVILFNHVQVPHYNYVGDSVLGFYSHMGAGSITSNVKADKTLVHVKGADFDIDTGLKKFGAMLGDHVEIGCNSVLNPGSVIGSHSNVYPVSMVRGVVPADSIYKEKGEIAPKRKAAK